MGRTSKRDNAFVSGRVLHETSRWCNQYQKSHTSAQHREEYVINVFGCDRVATLIGDSIKLVMSVSVVTCERFKIRETLVVSSL